MSLLRTITCLAASLPNWLETPQTGAAWSSSSSETMWREGSPIIPACWLNPSTPGVPTHAAHLWWSHLGHASPAEPKTITPWEPYVHTRTTVWVLPVERVNGCLYKATRFWSGLFCIDVPPEHGFCLVFVLHLNQLHKISWEYFLPPPLFSVSWKSLCNVGINCSL